MFRLPKIVLERLRRKALAPEASGGPSPAPGLAASQHPDANLLAAFVERSLTERERGQVLNHLAQCAGCRELVELTLPAEATPALLEHSPARPGWRAWPLLRWSALAATLAAVAVAVIWRPSPWRKQPMAVRLASKQSEQALLATAAPPAPPAARQVKKTSDRAPERPSLPRRPRPLPITRPRRRPKEYQEPKSRLSCIPLLLPLKRVQPPTTRKPPRPRALRSPALLLRPPK